MASAKGRVLSAVRGSIENGAKHWGFVSNGKQGIACRRSEIKHEPTAAQKIAMVKFANESRLATVLARVIKTRNTLGSISNATTDEEKAAFNIWGNVFWSSTNFHDANGDSKVFRDADFWHNFKNQPRSESGEVEFPTLRGYIVAKLLPTITSYGKEDMARRGGVTLFEETAEGYELMKQSVGDTSWLIADTNGD